MSISDVKIKICGLKREEDIDYVNEALPDFAGFVFAKSKRRVSFEEAQKLKKFLSPKIKAVGVFVNPSLEDVISLCNAKVIDLIQLHGDEDKEFILSLKSKTSLPVIKALKAQSEAEIQRQIPDAADYILLDSFKRGAFGGTGEVFDWDIIPKMSKPLFLAGGLNLENVAKAIKAVKPFCVDISSGVESEDAKDREKIIEITKLIRGLKI